MRTLERTTSSLLGLSQRIYFLVRFFHTMPILKVEPHASLRWTKPSPTCKISIVVVVRGQETRTMNGVDVSIAGPDSDITG